MKKIIGIPLTFIVIGLIGIVSVSAALLTYFGQATTTLNVESPIVLEGNKLAELNGMGGGIVVGEELIIKNKADFNIDVEITSDNDENEVVIIHRGTLVLTEKVVDFNTDVWNNLTNGETATVEYTLIGDEFEAEVISGEIEGYVLIYYKDNSDRFNYPAEVILVENVNNNLPYDSDGNADEYDYCLTGEYDTCHGAKIWYIPESAINNIDNSIDWSMASSFLYETELIQYNDAGIITMWPNSQLAFNPIYYLDLMSNGTVVVKTTVDLAE